MQSPTRGERQRILRWLLQTVWLVLLASFVASARADDIATRKAEALKHYSLGVEMYEGGIYDGALVEFMKSREIYPTRSALKNAATCLRELKRFDEALDMYEELIERFGGELPASDLKVVNEDVEKLQKYVGFVIVESDPVGSAVTVDSRARGITPLPKPVRVIVGTHVVRVVKEGFAPYESSLPVSSGEKVTVRAKLAMVSSVGTLRVREANGKQATVRLDGGVVGPAPWEGTVSVGTHTIALEGGESLESEARGVKIELGVTTDAVLALEPRKTELRVETGPRTHVSVDGKEVGVGNWVGRVPPGKHLVELTEPGHIPERTRVDASIGSPAIVRALLSRIRVAYFELALGGLPAQPNIPSNYTGQDIPDSSWTLSVLVRYGQHVVGKLGVEGWLGMTGGPPASHVNVHATDATGASGSVRMRISGGFLNPAIGASVAYRFFDEVAPITLRAMGGLALLTVFKADGHPINSCISSSGACFDPDVAQDPPGNFVQLSGVFGLDMRIGIRFSSSFVLDVGFMPTFTLSPTTKASWSNLQGWSGLPDPPRLVGGVAVAYPITMGFRFDL